MIRRRATYVAPVRFAPVGSCTILERLRIAWDHIVVWADPK